MNALKDQAPEKATNQLATNDVANVPVVAKVTKQITGYLERGTLHLPADYSHSNALKSAYISLQSTVDRESRPVLQSCSDASICNALLDMVVQGMNVSKGQGYFIAYGKNLTFQRSYFGDIALAQRIEPGIKFYYDVVFADDVFVIAKVRGKTCIKTHETVLTNQLPEKLAGAYCGAVLNGEDLGADVMTMDRIKRSWAMSKTYKPDSKNTPHTTFAEEMALRTVIRHYCKPIIRSSNDSFLLDSVRRNEMMEAEDSAHEIIEAEANQVALPVPTHSAAPEPETNPEPETEEEQPKPSRGNTEEPDWE